MQKIKKISKLKDPEIRKKNLDQLCYLARGRYFDLISPKMPDPVFIVGCSRSGTTVTYETVRQSRHLISFGYELPRLWNSLRGPHQNGWDSEAAKEDEATQDHRNLALRYFFQRIGKGMVLDKTCINVMRIPYLFKLFPNARFIYIHRDGRDNISSLMEGWRLGEHFSLEKFLGPLPASVNIENGKFKTWCFFLPPGWREYNNSLLEEVCAHQWLTTNRMALEAKKHIPEGQWIQVRYEDIFTKPLTMFRNIFDKLEIPFDKAVNQRAASLKSHPISIVKGPPCPAKWKIMNAEAVMRVLDRVSPMMRELGYGL